MTELKKLLKERDIHGAQVARKLGVSRAMVSYWARGKAVPRTKYLPALAELLNVSIETLMNVIKSTSSKGNKDKQSS